MIDAEVHEMKQAVEDVKYKLTEEQIITLIARHIDLAKEHFDEGIENYKGLFNFLDGAEALKKCNRIVFGAHGPYVEFEEEDALFEMEIPDCEEWRLSDKYKVKYYHVQPVGRVEKIYYQVNEVDYADYIAEKNYIDLYSLKQP